MLLWDKSLHYYPPDHSNAPNYWQEFKERLEENIGEQCSK
jgi:hypothetical protein